MPTNADNSPHILFPLSEIKPAKSISNLLSPKSLQDVKDAVAALALGPGSKVPYHSATSRWTENVNLPPAVEQELLEAVRQHYNDDSIEQAFIYVARYQRHEGNIPYLWTHMDQNACQHMIDFCVNKH